MIIKNYFGEKHTIKTSIKGLSRRFKKVFLELSTEIKSPKKTLNVLSKNFIFNFKLKDLQKFKKFKTIVIIGMGGSILGTEAIYNFLEKKIDKKIYFFNDLNIKKISSFKKEVNLKKTLVFVISKSGNTIETLSNAFVLNIIKKNSKNVILISEKNDSILFDLSKKMNLFYIEHKKNIGGRYSVLSEVGIAPAYLMGINVSKLRSKTLTYLNGYLKVVQPV